jgi:hypothetical protein
MTIMRFAAARVPISTRRDPAAASERTVGVALTVTEPGATKAITGSRAEHSQSLSLTSKHLISIERTEPERAAGA